MKPQLRAHKAGGKFRHRAVWLACLVSVLAVVFGILFLLLLILNSANPRVDTYDYWLAAAVMAIVFPVVGALIISRYPANILGWVFCVIGFFTAVGDFASEYATYALFTEPGSLSGGIIAAWVGSLAGNIGFASMLLIPLLFPDGRPPSQGWRPVVWLAASAIVGVTVSFAFMPGPLDVGEGRPAVINPFGIEGAGAALGLLLNVLGPISLAVLLAGVASLVVRFRRSRGDERQQIKWFTYAAVLLPASLVGNTLFPDFAWLIGGISVACVPIAIGVAVLKYRLYDIDLVINRTLVYGALTACVVGLYILIVGYLGALFRIDDNLFVSVVAAGLVAVLFAPLRDRLQRGVNRLIYGERDDPYAVLSLLGERMKAADAPEAVLPAIVKTVAQALKLPYVAIALKQDDGEFETVAVRGHPKGEPLVLPLSYGAETIGQLILSPRAPGEPFDSADKRLLDDLARHAEAAAYAVRLTADLQRSRERLVNAREEERRRLRRDLHDGLGPQLATLTLKLDAARNLISQEPQAADTLLAGLKAQTQTAISDIRRLVYGLRPPTLDDLGLVPAIREQATNYSQNGLNLSVEAPQELPPLPAAVEVAAYRIVQEALTNASRHARASECRIRFSIGDELELGITDNGIGLPEDRRAGVGLSSMRERAAELGGTCTVVPLGPAGGTRVLARLPLPTSSGEKP